MGSGIIKSFIRKGRRFVDLVEIIAILWAKERRYRTSLSLRKRMRAWRLGFLSDSYVQYFPTGDDSLHTKFLSDFRRWYYVPWINAKYGILLADKLLFYNYFSQYRHRLPEIHFLIRNEKIFDSSLNERSVEDLLEKLREVKTFFIKPKIGFGGRGVFKVVYTGNSAVKINDDNHDPISFVEFVKQLNNYLITALVVQDGYSSEIYPHSVNTVRILTIVDPITNLVRIAGMAHRFGSNTTGNVDNWTTGGLSASVDIENGQIGKCASNPKGRKLEWVDYHPDTGVKISGRLIPNWHVVVTEILEMASMCKLCPYIGWDIAISNDSYWVLEANDSPDVHILQIHEPLFLDPQNELFYTYHFKRLDVSFHGSD